MSAWQPWTNTTMDRRAAAAQASLRKADAQANAAHAPKGEMPAVVTAATGAGDLPAAAPLTRHNDLVKVQE